MTKSYYPLFSVLVANYNNGAYIKETIESVMAQDYPHWEIIIVDDASTDDSPKIYAEYANDSRIRVYINEENKGVTYTKWRCLEEAHGELCGFLDADDTILPHVLSLMVKTHQSDEDISIVSSRYYICDENMNITGESGYLRIPEGESYLTYMQYNPWPFISFKMSKYRQTKGVNRLNKIGDDQELCLLLEEVGRWHVLDDITYKYRRKSNCLSFNNIYKCKYWNLIVYHEACMRRGLDPEKYSYQNFIETTQFVAWLECKKSRRYKLGSLFIDPFEKVLRLLKK